MGKYDFGYTKADEVIAREELRNLERELGVKLDWKKMNRMNGDNMAVTLSILRRRLEKQVR